MIATPPGGKASSSSAFARAMFSMLPSSSRCTGAIAVMTATSGRASSARLRICPAPRIPISATTISVSGSIRQRVSGRPISLLNPSSAATSRTCGRSSAARMSFVEVLPTEPVIATTRALLRSRTRPRAWRAPRTRRRGRASPLLRARARRPGTPHRRRPQRRDRPARPGESRSGRRSPRRQGSRAGRAHGSRRAAAGSGARSRVRSASRAASRSSNGTVRSANS